MINITYSTAFVSSRNVLYMNCSYYSPVHDEKHGCSYILLHHKDAATIIFQMDGRTDTQTQTAFTINIPY